MSTTYSIEIILAVNEHVKFMSKSIGPELSYIIHTWFVDRPGQAITPSESDAELLLALYCSAWNLTLDKTGQTYFLSNHKLPRDYRVKLTDDDLAKWRQNIPTGKEDAVRLVSALSNRELFDQFNNGSK